MATYTKGNETKKRLIQAMYNTLKETNASEVTVRKFAKENNCAPPTIYRHFQNMEHLIILGSITFFMEYMVEYGQTMDDNDNLMGSYIKGWKLFTKHAFERLDLYYRFFWGKYNELFPSVLQEYFKMFPVVGSELHPAYFFTLMFTKNIIERDFLLLRRAANYGLISNEDAVYFSKSNTFIVKGMLEIYMNSNLAERKKGMEECNQLLLKNIERAYVPHKCDV